MSRRVPEPHTVRSEHNGVVRHAVLSPDQNYRYLLTRMWDEHTAPATFAMLNPSTADALLDDNTIRRCMGFARRWGAGGIRVVNLYAWRSVTPRALWQVDDPVGPANDDWLLAELALSAVDDGPLVVAWGVNARPDRVEAVRAMPGFERAHALHVTAAGVPAHPLYQPADRVLTPWPPAADAA